MIGQFYLRALIGSLLDHVPERLDLTNFSTLFWGYLSAGALANW